MSKSVKSVTLKRNSAYLLFMLTLSVLAITALAIEVIFPLDRDSQKILDYADVVVCGIFFVDFLIMLYRAEHRLRYLFTWGLLDLASSIPMVDFLRLGRIARVMRIFRVLRGVRAARILTNLILEKRAQSAFLAAALVSITLVAVSAISILHFEVGAEGSTIKSAEDALWWAVVTITTVGYGDKYPVTSEGRVVATILMVAGVGLFGAFSGFVASWFLSPGTEKRENEITKLREEVAEVRQLLQERKGRDTTTT